MIIDSHCHLDEFYDNPQNQEGVDFCLAICCQNEGIDRFINLLDNTINIYGGLGVHPAYTTDFDDSMIEKYLSHEKIVGLGEIGLEYFYDVAPRSKQIKMFEKQLDLSTRHNLPIIIHNRDSDEDMMAILNNFKLPDGGVLHCFSSSRKLWEFGLEKGFYISFSGMVTFKKLLEVQEFAKDTPLDKLLIETDSPYLAPTPYRGKPNRPEWVKYVGEKIAELKRISAEEVFKSTSENFFKLFKILR